MDNLLDRLQAAIDAFAPNRELLQSAHGRIVFLEELVAEAKERVAELEARETGPGLSERIG